MSASLTFLKTPVDELALTPPRLQLDAEAVRIAAGSPVWLLGTLIAPLADDAGVTPQHWLRSIMVLAITQQNQVPQATPLLANHVLFAEDFRIAEPASDCQILIAHFRFDLQEVIGASFLPERYFIHLSARRHNSNVVQIECVS